MNLKHFTIQEFDSPDLPGSGKEMDVDFLKRMDLAREVAGIPFFVTSGYRTQRYNSKIGGVKDSAHCRGYAADIFCVGSRDRFKMIEALKAQGFNRFGIGRTFIHVDNDPDKDPDVIWHYYSSQSLSRIKIDFPNAEKHDI